MLPTAVGGAEQLSSINRHTDKFDPRYKNTIGAASPRVWFSARLLLPRKPTDAMFQLFRSHTDLVARSCGTAVAPLARQVAGRAKGLRVRREVLDAILEAPAEPLGPLQLGGLFTEPLKM
jgi:hypothetical protein